MRYLVMGHGCEVSAEMLSALRKNFQPSTEMLCGKENIQSDEDFLKIRYESGYDEVFIATSIEEIDRIPIENCRFTYLCGSDKDWYRKIRWYHLTGSIKNGEQLNLIFDEI